MADKLQRAIFELEQLELHSTHNCLVDHRALMTVTTVYLFAMLSVAISRLDTLLLFALFPIIFSSHIQMGYGGLFCRSLVVLPFVALIGVFNPLLDRVPMLQLGNMVISRGWITFLSIIVRGLLSAQAVLLLIYTCGITGLCRTLQRMGLPIVLTTLISLIYRYMFVLLREAQRLKTAVAARSYGRTSWPLSLWGRVVALLLIRTTDRSTHIHMAMLARGFDGRLHDIEEKHALTMRDIGFIVFWSASIIVMRIIL